MGDLGDAYAAMSVQKCPCGAQPQGHPSGLCDACVAKRIVDRPAPTPTPAPGLDLDAVDIMPKPGETWHTGEDLALLLAAARAEIARLTAELAAARAEVDCGQDGPCAKAPGCARHWQERNRELVAELAAARAVTAGVCRYLDCAASDLLAVVTSLYETRARAISDATAARGTVGGLLATEPVVEYQVDLGRGPRWRQTRHGRTRTWLGSSPVGMSWTEWNTGSDDVDEYAARLVPAAEADRDPATRSPLLAAAPNLHPDGCHTADPTAPRDCTSDGHHECTSCARFDAAGRAAMGDDPIGGPRGPLPKGG